MSCQHEPRPTGVITAFPPSRNRTSRASSRAFDILDRFFTQLLRVSSSLTMLQYCHIHNLISAVSKRVSRSDIGKVSRKPIWDKVYKRTGSTESRSRWSKLSEKELHNGPTVVRRTCLRRFATVGPDPESSRKVQRAYTFRIQGVGRRGALWDGSL